MCEQRSTLKHYRFPIARGLLLPQMATTWAEQCLNSNVLLKGVASKKFTTATSLYADHCWCQQQPKSPTALQWRERERETYFKSHISLWEHSSHFRLIGRGIPSVSCCFSANVQVSLFGLPQGKSPGPHVKDQELNPRPHTPRPAALPVKVEMWDHWTGDNTHGPQGTGCNAALHGGQIRQPPQQDARVRVGERRLRGGSQEAGRPIIFLLFPATVSQDCLAIFVAPVSRHHCHLATNISLVLLW